MSKIYHYTRLSTAVEHILPKMQLRTGSLHKVNDPKENQPWAFGGVNIDLAGLYPDTYSDKTNIEHMFRFGNDIKNMVQIICFVDGEKDDGFLNEIMWAHYSENHKGVSLEIDAEKFIEENKNVLSDHRFETVSYGKRKSMTIVWDKLSSKEENFKSILNKSYHELFLTKSKYWEHENEKRLLIFSDKLGFLSIRNSLTGIYFGLFMPYAYRPAIDHLIEANRTKLFDLYYEGNQIKKVERDKGDFKQFIMRKYYASEGYDSNS